MSELDLARGLAALAAEYWRLIGIYEKAVAKQPVNEQPRGAAQIRYSAGKLVSILKACGIQVVTYQDQPYEANLPVSVVNAEDVAAGGRLIIDRTLEPTLVSDGRVLSVGKVTLRMESE